MTQECQFMIKTTHNSHLLSYLAYENIIFIVLKKFEKAHSHENLNKNHDGVCIWKETP